MPEGCAWNIAGGVARWKIYLCEGLPSQLYSVAHTRNDSLLLGQMLGEQLSPQNGISGRLNSNIFDLFFRFISRCRVFISRWGGSGVTVRGEDWIRMNLSPCLSGGGFPRSWLCFTCLNVPVVMAWYSVSQANSNSPGRNKPKDFLQWRLEWLETDRVEACWQWSHYCSSSDIPRCLEISLHVCTRCKMIVSSPNLAW